MEAALAEYFLRRDRGESIDLSAICAAYPECEEELHRFVAQEQKFNRAMGGVPSFSVPTHELADHTLGDFRLVRIIGRGGMGIVWEAEQISLRRKVAVKLLPGAMCSDPRHRTRFQNEARILAQLTHPNIINVIAVGEERDTYYFAMQYVEGITADELMRLWSDKQRAHETDAAVAAGGADTEISPKHESGRPTELNPQWIVDHTNCRERYRQCARIASEIASGLAHAHACGILHRDVKPSNVLLDQNGTARLTDFGLARMYGDATLTATGTMLGTLRYASPEQLSGSHHVVDERTDVYSLGATLWEMVTGKRLFAAENHNSVITKVLKIDAPRPSSVAAGLPHDLETIIARAMAKEPADRYASAQALDDDLKRFLDGRPIQAKPISLGERAFRWANRNRILTTTAAVSLVLLLLGAVLASALVLRANSRTATALVESRHNEEQAKKSAAAAEASERSTREYHYAADMASAGVAWHQRYIPGVREMLDRYATPNKNADGSSEEDLRGFEWYFLDRQTRASASSLLYENKEPLYVIQFMPGGKEFLTAGKDGIVRWHDSRTGAVVQSLESKQREVNCVSYNPSRMQFATASDDGTVKIWNAADLSLVHSIKAQNERCYWAKFLDDERLVAGGHTGSIQLINAATGQIVRQYETPSAKSAAGELPRSWNAYIGKTENQFWTTANSTKGTYRGIHKWDVQTGSARKVSNDSALSTVLLDASEEFLFVNTNDGVRILDPQSGDERWSYQTSNKSEAMVLSPDERRLVVSDNEGRVYAWDLDLNNRGNIVPTPNPSEYPIQKGSIYSMAFAPDGATLITVGTDGCVRRTVIEPKQPFREVTVNKWNQASPQSYSGTDRLVVLPNEPLRFNQPSQNGVPQRFSIAHYPSSATMSDGMLVASYAFGHLGIMKLATGEVVSKLRFDREFVLRPELSPYNSWLAVVSHDKKAQRLDVLTLESKTWECYTSADPLWAYFCVDDGLVTWLDRARQLVCFNVKDTTVRWKTKPGEVPGGLKAAVSRDGNWLITINGQRFALVACETGTVAYRAQCEHVVDGLAFSANGRSFVVAGPQGQLSVWQTATGQRLFSIATFGAPIDSIHSLDRSFLAAIRRANDGRNEYRWYEF